MELLDFLGGIHFCLYWIVKPDRKNIDRGMTSNKGPQIDPNQGDLRPDSACIPVVGMTEFHETQTQTHILLTFLTHLLSVLRFCLQTLTHRCIIELSVFTDCDSSFFRCGSISEF